MTRSEQPTSGSASPGQSSSDAFWAAAELGAGFIELDREECFELLSAKSVGRIAYPCELGPAFCL